MPFSDYTKPEEIANYLRKVLSRPGGKKNEVKLYHYTTIQTAVSIIENHSIWLGSTDRMNDYLEGEFIQSAAGRTMHFCCFSKVEENLAMYKMYGPGPDGVMLEISYGTASRVLDEVETAENGKKLVSIVRDGEMTEEQVEADVYWSEVCYKDLHTDILRVGKVENGNIRHPLTVQELAGYVKLYGWEYEKEVRLCADIGRPLEENERIAIKLPDDFELTVVFGPEFDKSKNRKLHSKLKRLGVLTRDSEYDALVDLGGSRQQFSFETTRIAELEAEVARLKKVIADNDLEDEGSIDYDDDIWEDGYHEVKNGDGEVLKKGQFIRGKLIDGIEYNVLLRIATGEEGNEEPVPYEALKDENWHYREYEQYNGVFSLMIGYSDIDNTNLAFFYIVDKKVTTEGKMIKPTFTHFRTLESFLAEKEPDELDYIKTGIRKYEQTDYADVEVD